MSAFLTVGMSIIGILGFFVLVGLIFFRQRLKAILSEGLKIYFDGEPRQVLECLSYDYNKETKKIALMLNDPARWGHIFKTGFIYDVDDFSPNLLDLDWRSYYGILKCFRNLDGTNDGREADLKEAHRIIKKLRAESEINKKVSHQQAKEYDLEQVHESKKEDRYHNAGVLRDLKRLTHDVEKVEVNEQDPYSKLMNQ